MASPAGVLEGCARSINASLYETQAVSQMLNVKKWERKRAVVCGVISIIRQKSVLLF